jgi:hypothetical protein
MDFSGQFSAVSLQQAPTIRATPLPCPHSPTPPRTAFNTFNFRATIRQDPRPLCGVNSWRLGRLAPRPSSLTPAAPEKLPTLEALCSSRFLT